jgi:hypothetical protein
MKTFILLVAVVFSSSLAMAAGGGNIQEMVNKPLYDINGDTVGTVIPVPDGCEVIVPQSGKAVYLMCEED